MWLEIICVLFVYQVFRYLIYGGDATAEFGAGGSNLLFQVASRLEKLYDGKAYVGLRIPDEDSGSHMPIDLVFVTKSELTVVAVRDIDGFVEIGSNGNWVCTGSAVKNRPDSIPDPVMELKRQTSVLESYLEQRGVVLPKGHLIGKVLLPNTKSRAAHAIASLPEVVNFSDWEELKPGRKISGWLKGAFQGAKNETQDEMYQKLHFILSTSPMWDRLELKGNKYVLGEFLEFKGNREDMHDLRNIKRSKVDQILIQKASLFGLGRSRTRVLYSSRDYRAQGTSSASEWQDVAVKPNTEILFQAMNSKKPKKIGMSSVVSVTLSA